MNFFDKPIEQLTAEDVSWLISAEIAESQSIEYKRELAGERNTPDSWELGSGKINRPAITAIVKELVAFANAQGGTVILGIAESEEKPPRASLVSPIRDVIELAERLKRTCRDNIEPSVFGLEVVGIPTENTGSGVVVLKIPESPYGPHRSRCDKECYIRRNDDSMPMTMDEIQRRTLELSQRFDRIEKWFDDQRPTDVSTGWCIRAVARPTGPFLIPQIHRNKLAKPRLERIHAYHGDQSYPCEMWAEGLNWKPIVRGTSIKEQHHNGSVTSIVLLEDGSILFDWRLAGPTPDNRKGLAMNWPVAIFGNLLLAIERLRMTAKQTVEYAADVHITLAERLQRIPYWGKDYGQPSGFFEAGNARLGRYPISESNTYGDLTKIFETDLHNLAGMDSNDGISFNFTELMENIKKDFM
ncbi:Putative DNA-binding domain-containing protein [Filomicrobium insigne]|uniref:DNA-binding domain-containing protein n=1 Tax=Filomicrobium insigne TaxID=418854 RepID=A0A1H0N964_9HYPH|nr:ATP-binding protein [Filomicrobium insigne]SDO89264.1 Putative DNA-binding domain-containing protein [Filomicrobium insigne]